MTRGSNGPVTGLCNDFVSAIDWLVLYQPPRSLSYLSSMIEAVSVHTYGTVRMKWIVERLCKRLADGSTCVRFRGKED